MGVNEIIEKQNSDVESVDKHYLKPNLNADEWQTFIFSAFLNEYGIEQTNANIKQLETQIETLENLDYTNKSKKLTFINYILNIFLKNSMQMLMGGWPIYVGFVIIGLLTNIFFPKSIGLVFDYIFRFCINVIAWPLTNIFHARIEYNAFLKLLFSIVGFAITAGLVFAIIGVFNYGARKKEYKENDLALKEREQERVDQLKNTKIELDKYLPEARNCINECNINLKEIYAQNLIPEMYHNLEDLAMLYGYFASGAALTFQDAAKEYLQDQRTNQLVIRMEKTNDLLGMIARKLNVFETKTQIIGEKLDKLIEQNDRSIVGKLFPNNPISVIYSKSKANIYKCIKNI